MVHLNQAAHEQNIHQYPVLSIICHHNKRSLSTFMLHVYSIFLVHLCPLVIHTPTAVVLLPLQVQCYFWYKMNAKYSGLY